MLWVCLHFGSLSVEVFTRGADLSVPLVVTEGKGARRRVGSVNSEASAAGIRSGMSLGTAHALSPDLCVHARDPAAETRALTGLAAWAGKFTPWVSLSPPAVLLEVEGSLELFGGLSPLLERVGQGVSDLGYSASTGVAPTPLGAELLARSARGVHVTHAEELSPALSPLPLRVLGLPREIVEELNGVGLQSFGDCLGQPREGLSRRFGPALLETLDRSLGRLPDPRPPYVPPLRFESRLDLPVEVASTESLLFGAHRLLQELEGFLRARGAGALRFDLVLSHRELEPTRVEIGLSSPGRDPRRLLGLVRERLGSFPLRAPVTSVTLASAELASLVPRERDLFSSEPAGTLDPSQLLERLRARLGDESVQGIRLVPDHRPERSIQWIEPDQGAGTVAQTKGKRRRSEPLEERGVEPLARPVWLLPEPAPVSRETLSLLRGPERIESGWWDGADVARDYFVAEDAQGSRLWVYQERRGTRRWFVHGIFG